MGGDSLATMDPFSLSFLADVALGAGALGILWLVYGRFRETTILIPLAVLCGSGSAMGFVSAAIHVASLSEDKTFATQLVVTGLIVSSMLLPAFAHVLTLYPRQVLHPAARWGVGVLYVMGLVHGALSPTSLVTKQFLLSNGEPYAVPADTEPLLLAPAYVFLVLAIGWLAHIALRSRNATEKKNALMLLAAVVPAALFISVLTQPAVGWPMRDSMRPSVETMAFGWGILVAGAAIYRGWWRPPVPQSLRPILDASTDAILIVDENARVTTANQAARDMADLGDRRVEGTPLLEALPSELREKQSELLTMSVKGVLRGRIDHNTHEIKGAGATDRSFAVSVLPVGEGEGGAARGALIMVRDETSRIALADATARLANLQDLVIRVMGHDVKTPIAVIQGYAELARSRADGEVDSKGAEEIRRYMEKVLEAVTSSQLILANARAISRLSSGPGTGVAFEDLDLTRMARQAGEIMGPLASSKGIALHVDAAVNIFGRAPKGFESVFTNLLSNAVKYTPPGGRVDLTLRLEDGRAVARVADTGPGVPPESGAQLFAKFERLDAEKGKIEGQGLGLSIVASFIDLVGGHVRVEDRPDGKSGAVFVVELLAREEAPPAKPPTSSSRAGS